MGRNTLMAALLAAAIVLVPATARAGDLEDLKAAYEKFNTAYSRLGADRYAEMVHGNAVSFGNKAPFPTFAQGKDALRQAILAALPNWESFQVTPMNVEYRIIENVGIVVGNAGYSYKLKDGPPEGGFTRFMCIFTKVKGKWQMVASSVADIAVVSRD